MFGLDGGGRRRPPQQKREPLGRAEKGVAMAALNRRPYKWRRDVLLLGVGFLIYLALRRWNPEPAPIGSVAPSFRAVNFTNDSTVNIPAMVLGHVTLLSVWSYSCKFCPAQFAELDSLEQLYGHRGLVILAVSRDAPATEAGWDSLKRIAATIPSGVTGLRDLTAQVERLYFTTGIPEAFVLDTAGRIRLRLKGLGTVTSTRAKETMEALLPPPA